MTEAEPPDLQPNAGRFAGFADLYDSVRPTPPEALAELFCRYLGARPTLAVDLGSGTGLSARWISAWAERVIGVEPSDDMRRRADDATTQPNITYRSGWSHATGLDDGCADLVLAVQALHWMEPAATLAEVARLLRPGGLFAAIDTDWPPSVGSAEAEAAWAAARATIKAYEDRLGEGLEGAALLAPLAPGAASVPATFGRDQHADRHLAEGVRSWSKDGHLGRLSASGHFRWVIEVAANEMEQGDAWRLVELLRSQGDYQTLLRHGLDDERLGVIDFSRTIHEALGEGTHAFWFTYRARLAVR